MEKDLSHQSNADLDLSKIFMEEKAMKIQEILETYGDKDTEMFDLVVNFMYEWDLVIKERQKRGL